MFEAFSGFDHAILEFFHNIAAGTGGNLNWFVRLFTMLGDHGFFHIFICLFLLLFKKTRRTALTMTFAFVIGAILTNVILKHVAMRVRPYEASDEYYNWWKFASDCFLPAMKPETDTSFPSGHTTHAFAIGLALFMTMNKKWSWVGILYAVMMAASRLYLCVHYPSDILFGIIDGVIGAVGAYFIVKAIYKYLFKNADKKLIKFYFEFSILDIFKKKEKTETEE